MTDTTAPEATTEIATPNETTTSSSAPTEPATAPLAPEGDPTEDALPTNVDAARKLRNEARNLRTRLHEAEAERDTTTESMTVLLRQMAEMALAPTGVTPAALWASGANVTELLDEDGRIDPAKVVAAAEVATNTLGLRRNPAPNPGQGASAGGTGKTSPEPWVAAFSGKATR